jgi:hypothetical protein
MEWCGPTALMTIDRDQCRVLFSETRPHNVCLTSSEGVGKTVGTTGVEAGGVEEDETTSGLSPFTVSPSKTPVPSIDGGELVGCPLQIEAVRTEPDRMLFEHESHRLL